MGKHTDKLYVTHSEHAGEYGGSHSASSSGWKKQETLSFARLPFDCCALSLKPFEVPVCNDQGVTYDLLNIIPYLKKHGQDPVTGQPMQPKDLIRLHFAKNSEDKYHDPLTFKLFTAHTPIVAIRTSGNVYSKESVDRLNVKAGNWTDLLDNTPFTKTDIISLQDPHNPDQRDLKKFKHLDSNLKPIVETADTGNINVAATGGAGALLQSMQQAKQKQKESDEAEAQTETSTSAASTSKRPASTQVQREAAAAVPWNASKLSTNHLAASLTSTSAPVQTKTERALYDEEVLMFEAIKEKGYVKLKTNYGDMNVELYCDKAPRTCYNFLTLSKTGKYDGTIWHRLIPGFMVQGGDPTGTGRGGESMWGKAFSDEYDLKGAHRHEKRGDLSMANHGPNTNGSQFFITFRKTSHLDGKHTVFGQILGDDSQATLNKIEKVPIEPATSRPLKPVKLLDVSVFKNPFDEYQEKLAKKLSRDAASSLTASEKAQRRAERDKDRTTWLGGHLGDKGAASPSMSTAGLGSVGKYLGSTAGGANKRKADEAPSATNLSALPTATGAEQSKKKKAGGFGNFDSW